MRMSRAVTKTHGTRLKALILINFVKGPKTRVALREKKNLKETANIMKVEK